MIQAGIHDDLHPDHKTYQVDGEFSDNKPQVKETSAHLTVARNNKWEKVKKM